MIKPQINVTPLIDVLLVLLIIFMVVSPLKPTSFKTKIPRETNKASDALGSHPLVVALDADSSLKLNQQTGFGSAADAEKLISKLREIFRERRENGVYSENLISNNNLSADEKIERTVFVKAPRSTDYGSVARVIDAVKLAGANPISLQLDGLD